MLYVNQMARSVPDSHYGPDLDVMEAMHWTWQEYQEQPVDLVEELHVRLRMRAKARETNSG